MGKITLIEASAGSGKTHRLTLEYLYQLFKSYIISPELQEGYPFNTILAITFTNKAAGEMRERIIRYLKALAFTDSKRAKEREIALAFLRERFFSSERENLLRSRTQAEKGDFTEIISKTAARLLENLFLCYSDFNVRTIDSLMTSIIRVLIPELGIAPDTSIEIEYDTELDNFLNDYLESLTLEERTWNETKRLLKRLKATEQKHRNDIENIIKGKLREFFEKSLKHDLRIDRALSGGITWETILTDLGNFQKNLKPFNDFIARYSNYLNGNKIRASLRGELELLEREKKYNRRLIQSITSKAIFSGSQSLMLDKFILKRAPERDMLISVWEKLWKDVHNSLDKLLEDLSVYSASDVAYLFEGFMKQWRERRNHVLYVSELSNRIRELFQRWSSISKDSLPYPEEAVPYLYLKLSDRFKSFLFDEFQDTSELQFKALAPLTEEVFSSYQGATMLLVGDKKQAIYEWRGGRAELMEPSTLMDEFLPARYHGVETFTLSQNFRSRREIIRFNNQFWSPENVEAVTENQTIQDAIRKNFANSTQEAVSDETDYRGYVKITRIPQKEKSFLYEETSREVKRYIDYGYRKGDIAILVRKNDEIRDIVNLLEERGIETTTDESLSLSSSNLVNEIVAFMKFLEYPPDDLSFVTFVTGDILNAEISRKKTEPLSEHVPIKQRKIDISFFMGKSRPLYKAFSSYFSEIWDTYIDYFFRSAGLLPPYDLLQDFYSIFKVFDNFPLQAPFLLKLAEVIHDYEERGISSISSFLEEWSSRGQSGLKYSIEPGEAGNSVHVMTMHKAKGLEFPVVIIPVAKEKNATDNYYVYNGRIYYIPANFAKISSNLGIIFEEEQKKRFIAELNLLYVAFTRAKDILSVLVLADKLKNGSLQLPALVLGNGLVRKEIKEENTDLQLEYGEVKSIHRDFNKDEGTEGELSLSVFCAKRTLTRNIEKRYLVFKSHSIPEDPELARHGELIHELLSHLKKYGNEKELLLHLEELADSYMIAKEEKARITDYFSREDIKRFYIGDIDFRNELDIVAHSGKGETALKRVDRIVFQADRLMEIIDYKLGKKEPENIEQMKEYLEILKKIYPDYTFKCHLLYITENERMEI